MRPSCERAVSTSSARSPTTAPWLSIPVSASRRVASTSWRCCRLSRACAARKTRKRRPASSTAAARVTSMMSRRVASRPCHQVGGVAPHRDDRERPRRAVLDDRQDIPGPCSRASRSGAGRLEWHAGLDQRGAGARRLQRHACRRRGPASGPDQREVVAERGRGRRGRGSRCARSRRADRGAELAGRARRRGPSLGPSRRGRRPQLAVDEEPDQRRVVATTPPSVAFEPGGPRPPPRARSRSTPTSTRTTPKTSAEQHGPTARAPTCRLSRSACVGGRYARESGFHRMNRRPPGGVAHAPPDSGPGGAPDAPRLYRRSAPVLQAAGRLLAVRRHQAFGDVRRQILHRLAHRHAAGSVRPRREPRRDLVGPPLARLAQDPADCLADEELASPRASDRRAPGTDRASRRARIGRSSASSDERRTQKSSSVAHRSMIGVSRPRDRRLDHPPEHVPGEVVDERPGPRLAHEPLEQRQVGDRQESRGCAGGA